jgi:hypothetical protein
VDILEDDSIDTYDLKLGIITSNIIRVGER